mmetsp:Transcript_14350/g.43158  ORF Transcript_14350/g.43158 Transcript_14350/m.43158 type:complete len:446 (-) Transcript_14350:1017-2354(-)
MRKIKRQQRRNLRKNLPRQRRKDSETSRRWRRSTRKNLPLSRHDSVTEADRAAYHFQESVSMNSRGALEQKKHLPPAFFPAVWNLLRVQDRLLLCRSVSSLSPEQFAERWPHLAEEKRQEYLEQWTDKWTDKWTAAEACATDLVRVFSGRCKLPAAFDRTAETTSNALVMSAFSNLLMHFDCKRSTAGEEANTAAHQQQEKRAHAASSSLASSAASASRLSSASAHVSSSSSAVSTSLFSSPRFLSRPSTSSLPALSTSSAPAVSTSSTSSSPSSISASTSSTLASASSTSSTTTPVPTGELPAARTFNQQEPRNRMPWKEPLRVLTRPRMFAKNRNKTTLSWMEPDGTVLRGHTTLLLLEFKSPNTDGTGKRKRVGSKGKQPSDTQSTDTVSRTVKLAREQVAAAFVNLVAREQKQNPSSQQRQMQRQRQSRAPQSPLEHHQTA